MRGKEKLVSSLISYNCDKLKSAKINLKINKNNCWFIKQIRNNNLRGKDIFLFSFVSYIGEASKSQQQLTSIMTKRLNQVVVSPLWWPTFETRIIPNMVSSCFGKDDKISRHYKLTIMGSLVCREAIGQARSLWQKQTARWWRYSHFPLKSL